MDIIYRFDPFAPVGVDLPKTNREALRRLETGNERFAKTVAHLQAIGTGQHHNEPLIISVNPIQLGVPIVSGLEPAHSPFALVLGCSDARVPLEHILDCSANDLFVVRVAGNVLGLECLGSVDYAATQLRSTLQSGVVMGHTGCGAVTAAVDIYLSPANFADIAFSHAVRSLVDRLMLSVRGSERALERVRGSKVRKHKHYRDWLITTSIYLNAAITAFDMQREINAVAKSLLVSFSVYDVAMTRISALPITSTKDVDTVPRFLPAPKDAESFIDLADRIIANLP
ncbi:MAG: carbonic anhydrase [Pirellula sp.]